MGVNAFIALSAGLAVFTGVGAAIGIGIATSKGAEAISRNPEASGKIMNISVFGIALAEATAIYGLLVALILLLMKWS